MLHRCYDADMISERHRHRYEFNNDYRRQLQECGLTLGGTSPDGRLVETIELTDKSFYVGVQYHPEFKRDVYKRQSFSSIISIRRGLPIRTVRTTSYSSYLK